MAVTIAAIKPAPEGPVAILHVLSVPAVIDGDGCLLAWGRLRCPSVIALLFAMQMLRQRGHMW